ncbi:hypothetical protein BC567DRAFT_221289 [Phyllosticta citribraziliensis]
MSRRARRTRLDKTSSLIPPPHFCNDVRAQRSTVRVQPYQPVSSAHGRTTAQPRLLLLSILERSAAPVRFSEKRAPAASVVVFPVGPAEDRHVMAVAEGKRARRQTASSIQWHRLDPAEEIESTCHIKSEERRRDRTGDMEDASEIRTTSTCRSDLIHGRRSGCSDSAHLHVHDSSSCSKLSSCYCEHAGPPSSFAFGGWRVASRGFCCSWKVYFVRAFSPFAFPATTNSRIGPILRGRQWQRWTIFATTRP